MEPQISDQRPVLCAVLDGSELGPDPGRFAAALFGAGVDWIQLRDRTLEDEPLYQLACALSRAAHDHSDRRILVNRRADIALAAEADGVHLGFDAVDSKSARALLGEDAWIGASFHAPEEIEAAAESGLSYAHLAPIWDPKSKPASRPALGLEALGRATAFGLPVLAQGGLDPGRARLAIAVGATGIAVTGRLSQAADPAAVAAELRREIDRASAPTR
jgi:thiamine-phosphate pyrophosphorylase